MEETNTVYSDNECRNQILHFLRSKDDNLILLTSGILYTILTISKVSPVSINLNLLNNSHFCCAQISIQLDFAERIYFCKNLQRQTPI